MAHNRVFFLQNPPRTTSNAQTLPPPPPPQPSSTSSSTSFPILAISILGILTTAILLVSYYVFVIKCCLNWRHTDVFGRLSAAAAGAHHRRARSRSRRRGGGALDDAFFATFSLYAPSASPSRGLEEWAIRAIPIVRFKRSPSTCSGNGGKGGGTLSECAVCLGEFQDGEGLRQLPGCSHVFHVDCIDVWLQNSANCPLCRSHIPAAAPQLHLIPPIHHSLIHFPSPVQDRDGDVVIDFGARSGAETDHPTVAPPAPPLPAADEHPQGGPIRSSPQKKWGRGKLHHVSSMGDECLDVRPWRKGGDLERFALSPVQPIRRSISMDSSTDRHLYLAVQEILRQQRLQGGSADEGTSSAAAAAALVGGSGRIRRSFFSFGHCRSSRSAVLPIQCDP